MECSGRAGRGEKSHGDGGRENGDAFTSSGAPMAMGRLELFCYGFGDFSGQLLINFVSTFFLIFCTDVCMITASAAGSIFLFTRICDAGTDLFMGCGVDRTKTPMGSCRPWILAGMPVAAMSFAMMFSRGDLRGQSAVAWMTVWYFIYSAGTTMTGVPYGILPNVVTVDRRERVLMGVIRDYGANLAGFLVSTFGTLLLLHLGGGAQVPDEEGYRAAVTVVAAAAAAGYLIVFFTQRERYRMPRNDADIEAALRAFFKNTPAMLLLAIAFVFSFCLNFRTASTSYFCIYYLKDPGEISVLLAVVFTLPLILLPLVPAMIRRLGKRRMLISSGLVTSMAGVLVLARSKNETFLLLSSLLLGLALSCVFALVWASVPEAAEFGELKTGIYCPGVIYSIATFLMKCGSGLAIYTAGFAMDVIGYNYALEVQSVATERGFALWYGAMPLAAGAVMAVLAALYRLDDATVDRNTEEIRKRRLTAGC